jgi:hypothetical protein
MMVFDYENRQNALPVQLRKGSFGNHGSYSPDGSWVIYESVASSNSIYYRIYFFLNEKGSQAIKSPGDLGASDFDPDWRPVGSP